MKAPMITNRPNAIGNRQRLILLIIPRGLTVRTKRQVRLASTSKAVLLPLSFLPMEEPDKVLVGTSRFELEPFCGRERSGSPQAKSRAHLCEGSQLPRTERKIWSGRADLNLSRFAGVSAAGARRRNPERTGARDLSHHEMRRVWSGRRFELEPFCGRERSGSPQAKSRAHLCEGSQKYWSGRADLNCRPLAPQASAL